MAEQPLLPFGEGDESPAPIRIAPGAIASLAAACREHPLEEKVFVAPSLSIGHTLVERLAREGHAWANLRVETIRTLALGIAGPEIAREGLRLASRAQALALIEQSCSDALKAGSYFGQLRDRPGFHRAVQRTLEEIRAAGLSADALPAAAFEDSRKVRELKAIIARYDEGLRDGRFIDAAAVLRRAVAAARPEPAPARYLVLDEADFSAVERELLSRLSEGRLQSLVPGEATAWEESARRAHLLRAIGEENEIREVFRRVLAGGVPFDEVEILHTDSSTYPALVWELSREHAVDCTFAGGVAAPFTRPGQAALAFLDWIAGGFEADVLRKALVSGTLTLDRLPGRGERAPGTRAVARALREAQIGWGASRHRTALERLIVELSGPEPPGRHTDDATAEELAERAARRDGRLETARAALAFASRALELATEAAAKSCDLRALSRGCRLFVAEFARVTGPLDAAARDAIAKLLGELEVLPPNRLAPEEAAARLADAVHALSIEADRPRPGRVHVAEYRAGGFSGRAHTYLLGLDAARHPGADIEDPVLLDAERQRINRVLAPVALPLYRDRPRESSRALRACVARLRGSLTASFPSWNVRSLDQQSEQFPSPFFLDLHRARTGKPEADYTELLAALPEATGFLPGVDAALDDTEWWLSRLDAAGPAGAGGAGAPLVREIYPHLDDGHRAEAARESEEFTVYDGWIRSGTPELDPRESGEPQSASRLETLAECPFRYFLKHVLRIEPPRELERDTTEWLDAMNAGSLLHDVFRLFLERITAAGEKPEAARHAALLEEIADGEIAVWREKIPPASELAFGQRRDEIRLACRIFLALEEKHCREVTPRFFEVPFGLARAGVRGPIASPDPVPIALARGESLPLRGSIDRVDEAPDGSFEVWDYKTGGTWRHKEERGIHGGRQIQHALYAMALEELLKRAGIPGSVTRSGYFFPGRKGEGQRMAMALDPKATREVLSRLLDLLRAGAFPHAVGREDCRFCDYESVCGGSAEAARRAKLKLERTSLPVLQAFREIHDEG
jgi:RecB family exonuclease